MKVDMFLPIMFLWLVAMGIMIAQPMSFPLWAIDLATIIFWVGMVPVLIFVGIFLLWLAAVIFT